MQKNKNKVIIFFIYKGDGESWQADFYLVFKVVVFNGNTCRGFLKIDNLGFELSHSKELSLKSLSTM